MRRALWGTIIFFLNSQTSQSPKAARTSLGLLIIKCVLFCIYHWNEIFSFYGLVQTITTGARSGQCRIPVPNVCNDFLVCLLSGHRHFGPNLDRRETRQKCTWTDESLFGQDPVPENGARVLPLEKVRVPAKGARERCPFPIRTGSMTLFRLPKIKTLYRYCRQKQ